MAIITDPDWIDPEETTFDVGKPIRSEQGVMLAGNPIAIAMGKPGAPRNLPGSLDIYLGSVFVGASDPVGLTDLDDIDVIQFHTVLSSGADFRVSSNGGATWGSYVELTSGSATPYGAVTIAIKSGWFVSTADQNGAFAGGAGVNAIQFRGFVGIGTRRIRIFGLGAGA
jgi:hypothetical protein